MIVIGLLLQFIGISCIIYALCSVMYDCFIAPRKDK
jgi:hypothetical protein